MTTVQKKSVLGQANPIAHLTEADIEQIGIELDAIRQEVLDAAEDAGMLMPSGCRMGICMGCVIPLREGSVRDLRNGAITTAVPGESGDVKVQTCINAAAGPCHIVH